MIGYWASVSLNISSTKLLKYDVYACFNKFYMLSLCYFSKSSIPIYIGIVLSVKRSQIRCQINAEFRNAQLLADVVAVMLHSTL